MSAVPAPPASPSRLNWHALLLAMLPGLVLLFAAIPYEILDLFESYSKPGGHWFEKLHPVSVMLLIMAAYRIASNRSYSQEGWERVTRASWILIVAICIIASLGVLINRTAGFSYLIDSLLVAPASALMLLKCPESTRRRVMTVLVTFVLVDAVILLFEFLTHYRLVPYPYELTESIFRPDGLLGHPLMAGLVTATAIPFVWTMSWNVPRRAAATVLLIVAAFACGARAAASMALLSAYICCCLLLWCSREGQRRPLVLLGSLLGGPAVIGALFWVLYALGLTQRFADAGQDMSAVARVQIYQLFAYLSPSEILFGTSRDWALSVVNNELGIRTIESSLVDYVLQFGVVGSAILIPAMLYFLWSLAAAGRNLFTAMGIAVFLLVGITNNSFSGKGPLLFIATVLAVCAQRRGGAKAGMIAEASA